MQKSVSMFTLAFVGLAVFTLSGPTSAAPPPKSWEEDWRQLKAQVYANDRRGDFKKSADLLQKFEGKWMLELEAKTLRCAPKSGRQLTRQKCRAALAQTLTTAHQMGAKNRSLAERFEKRMKSTKGPRNRSGRPIRDLSSLVGSTIALEYQIEKDPRLAALMSTYFPVGLEVQFEGLGGQAAAFLEKGLLTTGYNLPFSTAEKGRTLWRIKGKVVDQQDGIISNTKLKSWGLEFTNEIVDFQGNVLLSFPYNTRTAGFSKSGVTRRLQNEVALRLLEAVAKELIVRSETNRL